MAVAKAEGLALIRTDTENLWSEIDYAERVRDGHLRCLGELIETLHGSAYRGGGKGSSTPARIENHPFAYVSLVVPRLIYDNPRFSTRTKRMGEAQQVAKAIGHGLNRWVLDVNLRSVLTRLAYDMLFSYSAALICQQPMKVYDPSPNSTAHRPQVTRLPPKWFGFDPQALDYSLARYAFHCYPMDVDDLQEYDEGEGWDKKIIRDLSPDNEAQNPHKYLSEGSPDRNTVMIYEMWIPDDYSVDGHEGPSEGYHGSIHTLVKKSSGAQVIRKPRPFYGPSWGPYAFGGAYTVPDSPYPLSPLVATKDQQDELAAVAYSLGQSMAKYKRLLLVDKKNPKLVNAIKNAEHDVVLPVEGFTKDEAQQFEIGGITAQMIDQMSLTRDRLAKASGIDDAMRGNVTGEGTATEHSIAESSATMRLAFLKQQFADLVRGIGKSVAWYLFHDDRVVFPLGEDAAEEMGQEEPWFFGGLGEDNTDFDDIELDLDVYSMERTNEPLMQRNVTQALELAMTIAQAAPTMPWLRVKELLGPVADVFNMPQLLTAIDEEMLAGMGAPPAQPAQPQGGRMSADVSQERPLVGRYTGAEQGAARRA